MGSIIEDVQVRKILDSRGNPTIEVDVITWNGFGRAAAPSGASTGSREVVSFPDGGVDTVVSEMEDFIASELIGMDAEDIETIDESIVKEGSGAQNHSHKVVPRHVIDFLLSFLNGENQKAQHHDPRNEGGQTQFLQPCGKEGNVQTEQRKGCQHAGDNNFGRAFPDTDIGFSVVFFHDRL